MKHMHRLAALVFALFAIAEPARADKAVRLEPYVGKLKQVGVNIAGAEHRFLFDTGGGYTLISPRIAQAVGCTPTGRIAGFRMSGEKLETPLCANVQYSIASSLSRAETVGIFDLMTLLPEDLPRLDGVISLLSFEGRRIALDLAANRVVLDATPKGTPFPCRAATGLDGSNYVLFAAIERAGRTFWFEIDSGNLDAVRIAPHAALVFGLSPSVGEPTTIELSLGRAPAARIDARVADIIYDGALNARFLEQGVLHGDLGARPLCRWQPHPASR